MLAMASSAISVGPLSIDGTAVTSAEQLRAAIAAHKPGDKITVTVRRAGKSKTFDVTLGSRT